jgi:hypothetical protein
MLALHAAVANHYTRYNLILIGPFVSGAAFIIALLTCWLNTRWVFTRRSDHRDSN